MNTKTLSKRTQNHAPTFGLKWPTKPGQKCWNCLEPLDETHHTHQDKDYCPEHCPATECQPTTTAKTQDQTP